MSVGELRVMDVTGDTKTVWNSDNDAEVLAARNTFLGLKEKGYIAYRVDKKGNKGQIMTEFDATAECVILTPPLHGG